MRQQTLLATWREVQCAFISRFSDVHSKRQTIVALREVKQWKHETMEDYYESFYNCVLLYHNN
jgi:hypothetical protein